MADQQIYLSKDGKTYGPYSEGEIKSFRDSGELLTYSLIWNVKTSTWDAIAPPPPAPSAPGVNLSAQKSIISETVEKRKQTAPITKAISNPPLEVICHDSKHMLTGSLQKVSEAGGEFITANKAASPCFADKSDLVMNLLDHSTGKSMNVVAKIIGILRKDGKWIYQFHWHALPQILSLD